MKYRTRMEIVAKILETAKEGTSKTKIMYNAYLSYAQLKDYLAYLEEKQLIVCDDSKIRRYRLTPKGFQILSVFSNMGDLISLDPNKHTSPYQFNPNVEERAKIPA